ncbi:MAG: pyruvate ferredoxin oxidoreductase [Chloroflexi bacterium]|nr:pyruvate ferredoxin oxidoreductase [Chloroflexota bacterium]
MVLNLKEIAKKEDLFAPGHRACRGCAEPIIVRQVLLAVEGPVVVASPTGCLEIFSSPFPYTSWRVPWIHSLFENASSTLAGVETMYRSLVKQGKIPDRPMNFIAFGGDGATYDIGLQWLSGVLERGHKILYVCLNNEAYMNTGIQRSGATPLGTWTTTTPVGKVIPGKVQNRKNLMAIVLAHGIPYAAQASPHAWRDLMTKTKKALASDGPSFIDALSACPRGWRTPDDQAIALGRLAADTCVWPLYEVENGKWTLNYRPKEKKPVTEWLKTQGRFSHLLNPANKAIVDRLQEKVDEDWANLLQRCEGRQ